MKIEQILLRHLVNNTTHDVSDLFVDCQFVTIYDVACKVRQYLDTFSTPRIFDAFLHLDNGRSLNVSEKSFTVIYSQDFTPYDRQRKIICASPKKSEL